MFQSANVLNVSGVNSRLETKIILHDLKRFSLYLTVDINNVIPLKGQNI